jgi:hypothetical protein
MAPQECGVRLAATEPPLTAEQGEPMARILATVEPQERAA